MWLPFIVVLSFYLNYVLFPNKKTAMHEIRFPSFLAFLKTRYELNQLKNPSNSAP